MLKSKLEYTINRFQPDIKIDKSVKKTCYAQTVRISITTVTISDFFFNCCDLKLILFIAIDKIKEMNSKTHSPEGFSNRCGVL